MKNEQTDWPHGSVYECPESVPVPAQKELASILVGVPTMWIEHSNLSIYLAVCLPVYLLQLSLVCASLRVEGRLPNLLEVTFAKVTNFIANAEFL